MACAVVSAEPPVAQPFLTLMNGRPVSPRLETEVSALPAGVRSAGGEVDVLPADAGVGERAARGDRRHLQAGDALVAAERVDADADDGDVLAHGRPPRHPRPAGTRR